MLRVKVKPQDSAIEGKGLFADEFIPKGTVTWQYDPESDLSYDQAYVDSLEGEAKVEFLKYSYLDFKQNKYILCTDNQKYINHSERPNIQSEPDRDVAMRDIQPGEELVCNYEDYEEGWFERRGYKRGEFN